MSPIPETGPTVNISVSTTLFHPRQPRKGARCSKYPTCPLSNKGNEEKKGCKMFLWSLPTSLWTFYSAPNCSGPVFCDVKVPFRRNFNVMTKCRSSWEGMLTPRCVWMCGALFGKRWMWLAPSQRVTLSIIIVSFDFIVFWIQWTCKLCLLS